MCAAREPAAAHFAFGFLSRAILLRDNLWVIRRG
jgi:hypothetical protein